MKKYLIIFVVLTIFLTGCQKKEISIIPFINASSNFSQNLINLDQEIRKFGNIGNKATNTKIKAEGENKDFKLYLDFLVSGHINYEKLDFDLLYNTFIHFLDKKEQKETILSSKIEHKTTSNNSYIKFTDPFIDIGEGNYQSNLISLIAKNLENKWILIDSNSGDYFTKNIKDIRFIIDTLSNNNIFVPTGKHNYESKLAYKVQIKQESLDYINANVEFKIENFKGLLIVNSQDNVELKIDNLEVLGKEKFFIKGFLSKNKIQLSIKKDKQEEYLYDIKIDLTKKQNNIYVSKKLNLKELFELNINISNKVQDDKIKNQAIGEIIISPLLIYGSDLEKDIKIDINIQQDIYDQDDFIISKPETYIIGSQILGDEFSIKTIMSQDNDILDKQQ